MVFKYLRKDKKVLFNRNLCMNLTMSIGNPPTVESNIAKVFINGSFWKNIEVSTYGQKLEIPNRLEARQVRFEFDEYVNLAESNLGADQRNLSALISVSCDLKNR